jgi:asparagine synthase (glutamine-hydrolysing)
MIRSQPAASVPQAPAITIPWLLTLSRTEPGRVEVQGGVSAESGGLFAAIDGWLVDRVALAGALEVSAAASSDADLVLAAYRHFGDRAFDHLRGAFAVAIVDRTRGMWTVARDPVGLHPLFFAERGSSVLCASHQRTLVEQPGVSRELNRIALVDRLCQRWPDPTETYFSAVRRVMAGSRLRVTNGQFDVVRYWDPAPDGRVAGWLDSPEAIAFDERFDRAVSRSIEHGPIGVYLSGGLDSISVAAVAADRLRAGGGTPLRALSLGFPHPDCDERARQGRVANTLGVPSTLIDFPDAAGPRGLLIHALELNRTLGAPLLNTWAPAYNTLARRGHADGVRTILTGTGGDEWLTLSPFLSADLLSRGDVAGLARLWRAWQRSTQLSPLRLGMSIAWRFGLRPVLGRAMYRRFPDAWERRRTEKAVRHDPSWLTSDPELHRAQRSRARRGLTAADPRGGFYVRDQQESLVHALVSWELEEQHEFGQQIGVRFAHPYWDADLVDTLFRSTPALLNADGRSKGLVRQTLARRFPELGFDRQRKVVATEYLGGILASQLPGAFDTIGNDFRVLGALDVVQAEPARQFVERAIRGDIREQQMAWMLINLESWVRVQTSA